MNNQALDVIYANLMTVVSMKFVLILFIAIGIFLVFKKTKPWLFLILAGVAAAVSYYLMTNDLALSFWGLKGDEATIAAMYNTFAKVGFWHDFSYHNLAPFYPPLFFWIFSIPGKIMQWNGVAMAKFAAMVSFLLIPIGTYVFFKFLNNRDEEKNDLPVVTPFLFALSIFVLIDVDVWINKPYEIVAAVAAILWTVYLLRSVQKNWSWKKIVLFGVIGGLIFMTYYLWLIFATIAITVYGLTVAKKSQFIYYGRLILVAVVSLIVALPFLAPMLHSYSKFGTENWQTAIFTPNGLVYVMPALTDISFRGLILLVGLIGLIYYRKNNFIKPALCIFVTSYIWWAMGLMTVFFFGTPFQEFRGFDFLDRLTLGFAAAFVIGSLYVKYHAKINEKSREVVLILGILILSLYLSCGPFVDSQVVRDRMIASKTLYVSQKGLIAYLEKEKNIGDPLILSSGIAELSAFVPINNFVYFNQHNSNPAGNFSQRKGYLTVMADANTPKDFADFTKTPYGEIKRLILARDKNDYVIYFNVDEPVAGIKQEVVRIPAKLITKEYFKKVYEDQYFTVWDKK